MITTTSAVKKALATSQAVPSDIPIELLNVSALARLLQKDVEAIAKRTIQPQTIAVSLKRLIAKGAVRRMQIPELKIDTYNVQSGLVELTYSRTPSVLQAAKRLHATATDARQFLTVIYGVTELSIITKQNAADDIRCIFDGESLKAETKRLGCVSVQFDEKYLSVPNVLYALIRALASHNVNVVEVVSTYTELAFILAEDDMQRALGLLQRRFR